MKILKELEIKISGQNVQVDFGIPQTASEMDEMFRFRFQEYSKHDYIDVNRFPSGQERDEYDEVGKCTYFNAIVENRIIGTVRLIRDDVLPTENDFKFEEPPEFADLSRTARGELGRLIIVPYDRKNKLFFPRGIILLFLLSVLVDYGTQNGILGGYAFVKTSLKSKLEKLRLPAHFIKSYQQTYPKDGVLFRYFTQPTDPVVPMYFFTAEFKQYLEKMLRRKWLFETKGGKVILKSTWLTKLLKVLNLL